MNQPEKNDNERNEQEYIPATPQEKTTIGGDFNSGVTSHSQAERDEIEKKGALANIDQSGVRGDE